MIEGNGNQESIDTVCLCMDEILLGKMIQKIGVIELLIIWWSGIMRRRVDKKGESRQLGQPSTSILNEL